MEFFLPWSLLVRLQESQAVEASEEVWSKEDSTIGEGGSG